MRLYPPAYIIGRRAANDAEIGGVLVPKGRVLLVNNVAGIHRRTDVFPRPDHFDLDRLTTAAEKRLPPLAYMPFGAGPRVCIGNHFATMEAQVVLVTLMQHLRVDLRTDAEIGTEPLITLRPKGGVPARVSRRVGRHGT